MIPLYRFMTVTAVLLSMGFGLLGGCGKKGPPLPPLTTGNMISPPTHLAYTLDGDQVTVTWRHQVDPTTAKIAPEGFEVFMATKSVDGCQGCPFIFKSVGMVPMPQTAFVHTLAPDLSYYFRVQAVGSHNLRSKSSKTLNVERGAAGK